MLKRRRNLNLGFCALSTEQPQDQLWNPPPRTQCWEYSLSSKFFSSWNSFIILRWPRLQFQQINCSHGSPYLAFKASKSTYHLLAHLTQPTLSTDYFAHMNTLNTIPRFWAPIFLGNYFWVIRYYCILEEQKNLILSVWGLVFFQISNTGNLISGFIFFQKWQPMTKACRILPFHYSCIFPSFSTS